MFERVWELFMSFVYFVLNLFGIKMGEKHVHFEDKQDNSKEVEENNGLADAIAAVDATYASDVVEST